MNTRTNNTKMGTDRNSNYDTAYFNDPSPDNIEDEINVTRSRMDSTIDRLSEKLNPSGYVDDAVSWVKGQGSNVDMDQLRDSFRQAKDTSAEFAKENPLPIALLGLTVASLFLPKKWSSRSDSKKEERTESRPPQPVGYPEPVYSHLQPSDSNSYGAVQPTREEAEEMSRRERARQAASAAGEKVRQGWEQTTEKLGETTTQVGDATKRAGHRIGEGFSHAGESARTAANRTGQKIKSGSESAPIAMGLGIAAVGVLAGILLPHTRSEDEKVGAKADRLKREAKNRAKNAVRDACGTLREKTEEAGMDPKSLEKKTEEVLTNARSKAEDSIDDMVHGKSQS